MWYHRPYQNLGQIDHNLHDHIFDDVMSKPPIEIMERYFKMCSCFAFFLFRNDYIAENLTNKYMFLVEGPAG